ncbi:MAG: ribonuclease [Burkholderiales bacterium]|nr:ribonuclease [Burkholderiales bacterium]
MRSADPHASRRAYRWLTALLFLLAAALPVAAAAGEALAAIPDIAAARLPTEARDTLRLIRSGGPFPHERDGVEFRNFEQLLPRRERGYYREYTVSTPGTRTRGARRIVAGRGDEYYYTADHYRSFSRIRE